MECWSPGNGALLLGQKLAVLPAAIGKHDHFTLVIALKAFIRIRTDLEHGPTTAVVLPLLS